MTIPAEGETTGTTTVATTTKGTPPAASEDDKQIATTPADPQTGRAA
jgi:hypothetical protein